MRKKEQKPILTIPPIVWIVVVRVEPLTIIVAAEVEQVRITIRNVRFSIFTTALRSAIRKLAGGELSQD